MKNSQKKMILFSEAKAHIKVGQRIETNGYNLVDAVEGVVSRVDNDMFVVDLPDEGHGLRQQVFRFDIRRGSEYWIAFTDEAANTVILPEGVEPGKKDTFFTVEFDLTGWSQEKRDRFFHFAESYVNQQLQGGSYIPDLVIKRAHHYAHSMVSLKGL